MYVCLWNPDWSTDEGSGADGSGAEELGPDLAELAPRLRVEREVVWADGRGLNAVALAGRLLDRLAEHGVKARAGLAAVPVCAELAARYGPRPGGKKDGRTPFLVKERTGWGWRRDQDSGSGFRVGAVEPERGRVQDGRVVEVPRGREREWMGGLPVTTLATDPRLRALLDGVGVGTVGALAALEREAVEVRFGGEAVRVWRLAQADDRRVLFRPIPPERPHGSIDFVDYVLTDPARLLFTANALLGPLCDRLTSRGEHARAIRMVLPLADGGEWDRTIRPARPTASRDTWLRLVRGLLDRLTVPDAVAGMSLEVQETEVAGVHQGDLFDRGFATASAVEAAVGRLAERQVLPLAATSAGHPLVERRADWRNLEIVAERSDRERRERRDDGERRGLTLQLLPEPRRVVVETVGRRDHEVPVRLHDRGGWREVVMSAGPDRISGGQWEVAPYAREYHRCVTDEGVPLWVYRDALDGSWYLHGYWD